MASTVLAVMAATWGVVMAVSPLLQIRRIVRLGSSRDVSIGYLAVLVIGSACGSPTASRSPTRRSSCRTLWPCRSGLRRSWLPGAIAAVHASVRVRERVSASNRDRQHGRHYLADALHR